MTDGKRNYIEMDVGAVQIEKPNEYLLRLSVFVVLPALPPFTYRILYNCI